MNASAFTVLEHKLPERIGLSLNEIVQRRNRDLIQGTDWVRQGRWIKWSEDGLRKFQGQIEVPEINPVPPPPQERQAQITRMNFPNQTLIEVAEFDGGRKWLVRVKPEWRSMYRVKQPITILTNGSAIATTRRPRPKFI